MSRHCMHTLVEKFLAIAGLLGQWAYLLIFLAVFLETAAFVGLVVPGETIVILSGLLASRGYLDLGDCLWVIALGAVLGDSVGYSLGKRIGRDYFERHKRLLFLKERHIRKADEYFRKHGGKTVLFGRFIGFLRAMAPFAAGMSKMPYWRFFIYNLSGGILWTATFTLLGYFFGQSWQLIGKWSGKTGLFVFIVLLIVSALAYLFEKASRKHAEIYAWTGEKYQAFISLPPLRHFMDRHPALVAFVRDRLSPGGYLGLHLTIGFAVSVVFLWILGGVTEDILSGDPLVNVDKWVLNRVLYFQTPAVTKFMVLVTNLGSGPILAAISFLAASWFLLSARFDSLVCYISAVAGGSFLVLVLKQSIHRMRPAPEHFLLAATGWSFPSGHAMMSMICYGMIAYFLVRNAQSWRFRLLTVMSAGFLVFLIGLSRLYLEVHYLSDVIAGFAGGAFWLTVCITGLEIYRKKRGR